MADEKPTDPKLAEDGKGEVTGQDLLKELNRKMEESKQSLREALNLRPDQEFRSGLAEWAKVTGG